MTDTTLLFQRRCAHCGAEIPPGISFCSQCGAGVEQPGADDPLLSRVRAMFGGEYQIEREIGRGGMAVVYSAFDPGLQRRVAVKVLPPEFADSVELAERFRREARLVASLQHPNIVNVYGVRTDGELQAIVMQFVEGRGLDAALKQQPVLSPSIAGLILAEVAAALQHAHDRGIVHRDVKPANVLLDSAGHAVVTDFGIGRREGGTKITGTGVILGTAAYMSPEQCAGDRITAASDQYSFGVLAFELLSGRRLFEGTVMQILKSHSVEQPPDLATLQPGLPNEVVAYVARALAKEPEDRHADLRGAEAAFRQLVADPGGTTSVLAAMARQPVVARQPARPGATEATVLAAVRAPRPQLAEVSHDGDGAAPVAIRSEARRVSRPAIGVAVAAVLIGAALAAWTLRHRPTTTAEATTASAAAPSAMQPENAAINALPRRNDASAPASSVASGKAPAPSAPQTAAAITAARTDSAPRPVGDPAAVSAATPPTDPSSAATAAPVTASAPASGAPATPALTATLDDARAIVRQFVTMCNQRRWHELESLGSLGGDAQLREQLIKAVHSAPDFSAGLDRVASSPVVGADHFVTEFVIDLEWRGGKSASTVRLQATHEGNAWRLTSFGTTAPP